ncbi:MAG: argininosuccinate synthase [Paracoccaceae bacterium]
MKIVLAYSGGLDTSIALAWLKNTYKADVVAFCADLGQNEDLSKAEDRAQKNGASAVYIDDLREEFVKNFAFPAMRASALYEQRYHMAASLGRPLISKRLVEIAEREGADAVAHGATGKGNDQIRFFTSVTALNPDLKLIAPVMEWDLKTRSQQIEYATQHGIEIPPFKTSPYSRDSNLWGTSVECGILDELTESPPDDAYTLTEAPGNRPAETVEIGFVNSLPTQINGDAYSPVDLVAKLNEIGGRHGIGRLDIVENRLVGFKVRGVYESPAAEILFQAKRELDALVHERDLLHLLPHLSQQYGQLIYDGKWFSQSRSALDHFFAGIAQRATGIITLELASGRISVLSREANHSLYNLDIASYESEEGFDQTAGVGFAYIWAMQGRVAALRDRKPSKPISLAS